jgi:hypothetical protein
LNTPDITGIVFYHRAFFGVPDDCVFLPAVNGCLVEVGWELHFDAAGGRSFQNLNRDVVACGLEINERRIKLLFLSFYWDR